MGALLEVNLVGLDRRWWRSDSGVLRLSGSRFVLGFLTTSCHEGEVLEELFHVGSGLGGHLHEWQTKFLELLGRDVDLYGPFVLEVLLIADDEDESLVATHFTHIVNPFGEVVVGVGVCVSPQLLVISYTMTAALQSLMYEGMSEWKRSWPAVSHNCMRRLLLSTLTVLLTKSTPTVGCIRPKEPARGR